MAWIVMEQIERGMTWDEIADEWDGKISGSAIAETIGLSHLIKNAQAAKGPVPPVPVLSRQPIHVEVPKLT